MTGHGGAVLRNAPAPHKRRTARSPTACAQLELVMNNPANLRTDGTAPPEDTAAGANHRAGRDSTVGKRSLSLRQRSLDRELHVHVHVLIALLGRADRTVHAHLHIELEIEPDEHAAGRIEEHGAAKLLVNAHRA